MQSLSDLGKVLIAFGGLILLIGVALVVAPLPFLGRLPGDILVQRDGFTVYISLMAMLLLSLALTILFNVILRLFR